MDPTCPDCGEEHQDLEHWFGRCKGVKITTLKQTNVWRRDGEGCWPPNEVSKKVGHPGEKVHLGLSRSFQAIHTHTTSLSKTILQIRAGKLFIIDTEKNFKKQTFQLGSTSLMLIELKIQ